jgi:hypothetical protein
MFRLVSLVCIATAWPLLAASQSSGRSVRALEIAIRNGDASSVETQLSEGVPVNREIGLHTPLTLSIASGKPQIVSLLLRRGAQPSLPYASLRFSRDGVEEGSKLWMECEGCHRLETSGPRQGPALDNFLNRKTPDGKAPAFENIIELVTKGRGSMPAFKDRMSRAEINAVVSYFVASLDPYAGLMPYDLALVGCNREVIGLLRSFPRLLTPPSRSRITTYAESMAQIVRLQQDLCVTASRFGNQPNLAAEIERSRANVAFLLGRWRQFARTNWRASNYDVVWPLRATALENLQARDARAAQVLVGLRHDLDLAVDDCRNNPLGMGTVRTVNIQTLRDGVPESGWQVFFKFKILELFPEVPAQPFPNLSSPATWKLPPGNYLIYAQKRKQTSQPMPITVDRRVGDGTQWQIPLP